MALDPQYVGIYGANNNGWVCSQSQAAFVAADSNTETDQTKQRLQGDLVGIELINTHVSRTPVS